MSKYKKIIITACAVGFGIICFLGGYYTCNRRWSKLTTNSSSELRAAIDKLEQSNSAAVEQLGIAKNRVDRLESTIDESLKLTEQNNIVINNAQATSNNIAGTTQDLEQLFELYFTTVGQLQGYNQQLENRLRSSLRENAGE